MNFTVNKEAKTATSDCGYYRISWALNNAKYWFNAVYLPTQRSIEGSYDKDACKLACQKHAQRMIAEKASLTGARCA